MTLLSIETYPEKIYYFRHGESAGNELGLNHPSLKGIANHLFPLTSRGERTARELGHYIKEHDILSEVKLIYSSTFLRAKRTLEIVLEEAGSSTGIATDSRLDEYWQGIFQSMSPEDIDKYFSTAKAASIRDGWYQYRPPEGEAGKDVDLRIISFLSAIRRNILIGGHGDFAGFMKRILCDEPIDFNCDYSYPKNCELWLFTKGEEKYSLTSLFVPPQL